MKRAHVKYESTLIEEAVFLTARQWEDDGCPERAHAFYHQRDALYDERDIEKREADFKMFYSHWFSEAGLRSFFEELIAGFPMLCDPALQIIIRRVWTCKEERAELYVEGPLKTMVLGIQTAHLVDRSFLESFLRHELMHISDMLDPAFGYSPNPRLGGENELESNLIRERFRILWDLYVSSRLGRRGFGVHVPFEKQRVVFDKVFSRWDSDIRGRTFQDIRQRTQCTQGELLRLASDRRLRFEAYRSSAGVGS